jgi:hypothetical protein
MSVVTIPMRTNPPCKTGDAAEEIGTAVGRIWTELMLKALCLKDSLWQLRRPRALNRILIAPPSTGFDVDSHGIGHFS